MAFAVVRFLKEEESFSEVPTSWLSADRQICYWPKQKNCGQLMAKGALPEKDWSTEFIEIEGYYDTLEKARKVAEDPNYTSQDEGARRRYKPHKLISSSDSECSSQGSNRSKLEKPPNCSKNHRSNASALQSTCGSDKASQSSESGIIGCYEVCDGYLTRMENIVLPVPEEANVMDQQCEDESPTLDEEEEENHNIPDLSARLEKIYQVEMQNNFLLKEIYKKLNKLEVRDRPKISVQSVAEQFPFTNVNDIVEYESKLNSTVKEDLINYINKVGGKSMKDHTHRALRAIYSDDLGKSCSWLGQRGNFKIKDTQIMNIIKDVMIHEYNSVTLAEFESVVKEWFRLATSRLKIKKKE